MSMITLDDLLSNNVPGRGKVRSNASRMVRTAIVSVVGSIATVYLFRLSGADLPFLLVLATFLALGAIFQILRRLRPPELPQALRNVPESQYAKPPFEFDGAYRAARRWAARLEWTEDDLRRFAAIVQPAIIDVADERLRLRHSITRGAEPERARALCGPELWQFLTVPISRPLHPHEIATLIAQMEAL